MHIKYVPVPYNVPLEERLRVGQKDYHMFFMGGFFEQLVVESLEIFLRREAQEIALDRGKHDGGSVMVYICSVSEPLRCLSLLLVMGICKLNCFLTRDQVITTEWSLQKTMLA